MKFTIDFNNKTIELLEETSLDDLLNLSEVMPNIREFKLINPNESKDESFKDYIKDYEFIKSPHPDNPLYYDMNKITCIN